MSGLDSSIRTHYRSCAFCEAACGIEIVADHETRRIVGVRGDKLDPLSRGFICPKAYALTELHSDPDRLHKPLRRRGRDFEEIGWDEAIDMAVERLDDVRRRHGASSIGSYFGNPSAGIPSILLYGGMLIETIGSPHVYSPGSVDQFPKFLSQMLMFGGALFTPLADIDNTDHLIVIGSNPVVAQGSLLVAPGIGKRIEGVVKRGGKVVVIDPRRTETAAIASEHVSIRPGTDAYLLLAMLDVLFRENRIRLGRAERLVKGLDQLEKIAACYPAERVAPITGVNAEVIVRLARELSDAPTAAVYGRTGVCTQRFGTIASWLTDVLNTVTGNLDIPGGSVFSNGGVPLPLLFNDKFDGDVAPLGRWHSRVRGLPEIFGMMSTAVMADEILTPGDGQVRAFITMAGNLVLSTPGGARLQEAFESLDFMLSFDIYVNETTRHADLIIPGNSYADRPDFSAGTPYSIIRRYTKWGEAIFDPEPGVPYDWQVYNRIAGGLQGRSPDDVEEAHVLRLLERALREGRPECRSVSVADARAALGETPGPDRVFDIMLRAGPHGDAFGAVADGLNLERLKQFPHGLDYGPHPAALPHILATPDQLIDLAPTLIVNDLPRLDAAFAEHATENSLLLIGRRHVRSKNSWMHNVHLLVKGKDRCTLLVNPLDAAARGLATGDIAKLETSVGSLDVPVEVSDEIMAGVVSLPHGWGHDLSDTRLTTANAHAGKNTNAIIDAHMIDVPAVTAILNGVPVTVSRITQGSTQFSGAPSHSVGASCN